MDDELTRARHALRGVDPDLDLAGVYAESRSRARRASERADTVRGAAVTRGPVRIEVIEVRLSESAAQHSGIAGRHRRQVLAWGALAASVVIVGFAVGPSGVRLPSWPRDAPAVVTGTPSPARPSPNPSSPPDDIAARAALAMSADGICVLQTFSTLGDDSATRVDTVKHSGMDQPSPFRVLQPLQELQAAAVDAVLGLGENPDPAGPGTEEYLGTEQLGGTEVVRIRITPSDRIRITPSERTWITPSDPTVLRGEVTRIEYLIDAATWLPRVEETWVTSDEGEQLVLHSEFRWLGCNERSPRQVEDAGFWRLDSSL